MNRVLVQEAIKLNKERRRKKSWQKVVRFLAAGVVFTTTYALILPAITMNREAVCGIEAHEHGTECYGLQQPVDQCPFASHVHSDVCRDENGSLACGYGEQVIHSHNEFCYDAGGALVCGMEEISAHIHDNACYAQTSELVCTVPESPAHVHDEQCQRSQTEPVLICGQAEGEAHGHTEECYQQTLELVCTMEEAQAHSHGEECYQEQTVTVCGLEEGADHTHAEQCQEQQRVLVCTAEETEGHTHGDGCYQNGAQLVCARGDSAPHVHEESCYDAAQSACPLEETEGHTHTEACYQTVTGLVCQKPQIDVHTHGAECRDENGGLTCQIIQGVAHDHSDQCFDQTAEPQEVLVCGVEEHIHQDACYPADTGASETEYLCGYGVHAHGGECTDADGKLVCNIPEHTHEAACLVEDLDMTADVETREQWEAELNALTYTGVWAEDVLTIAQSQLGYQESKKNVILDENGVLRGYTRYGEWYGDHYGDWCGMFVSFCLHYAGVEGFPQEASCTEWIELLQEQELYRPAPDHTPEPGDVIFFDWQQPGQAVEADHVGLVVELIPATEDTPAQIKTIEGNSTEQVEYNTYPADDATIIGYGELPEQVFYCAQTAHNHTDGCCDTAGEAVCGMAAHVHSESCWNLSQNFELNGRELECGEEHEHADECYGDAVMCFVYQDDTVTMNVTVVSSVGIPKGTRLEVIGLSDEDYASYADYAQENSTGELTGLTGYRFRFLLAGEEIELEDARITVELTLNGPVAASDSGVAVMSAEAGDGVMIVNQGASGGENGLLYSTRSGDTQTGEAADGESGGSTDDQTASGGTVSVLGEENGSVTTLDTLEVSGETQTVTLSLGSGRSIALASSTNPEFKVQFYANIVIYEYSTTEPEGKISLPIIDTRGDLDASDGDYGFLPRNTGDDSTTGTDRGILYLHLDPVTETTTENPNGSNQLYTIHTERGLREIYVEDQFTYSAGMGMANIDKLQDNTSYTLAEVRVSYDNGTTWTSYKENLSELKFTNNSGSTDGSVYIQDGAVVRLVYDTTEGTYNNAANIFDYDITTAKHYTTYTASGTAYDTYAEARANATDVYMRTSLNGAGVGINSAWLSSSGQSANLAFGNRNTGVPYQDQKFNGYYLNRYNGGGYMGCHFGLVQGYSFAEDRLIYADGLRYQALFNDEAYYRTDVEGKTSHYRNALNFERTGDTYVLSGVNSAGAINGVQDTKLNYFFSPQAYDHIYTNNFWPVDGTVSDTTSGHDMLTGLQNDESRKWTDGSDYGRFPPSDDGTLHNSYFGMQFAVEFELDGEYCGPLEYLFYGDDDMWVFLTDLNNGTSRLICDIGGVHSSVGSITDLWDYIPRNTKGNYALTVFYTERGASGSSCYIEFTLPQVTSITQNTPTTGSVSVGKEAVNESVVDAEYTFQFDLAAGADTSAGLNDKYSYEIKGNSDTRTGTIASGGTFTMKADETFTVVGIPEGLVYTITEVFASGMEDAYNVNWVQDANATVTGASITGTIEAAKTHSFTATNHAAGTLELKKEIVGTPTEETFHFLVKLTDGEGNPVSGTYGGYTWDESGMLSVPVRHNETVTLTNLPVGTHWTVTEETTDGYDVTYKVDGAEVETAAGTIAHDQTVTVTVVNATQYALPNTGGTGAEILTFGGLLITAAAIMYICESRRKRRKGGV